MKAIELIEVPNLRAFEKGTLKPGMSSSCRIYPGKEVEESMRSFGYDETEVAEYRMRIMKGNPHWVSLENKEEKHELEVVKEDKQKTAKRKEELLILTKKEQIELLKQLGVTGKDVPHFEVARADLIIELENKKKGFFD